MSLHTLEEIIRTAVERNASDVHIVSGLPVRLRIDGDIVDMDDVCLDPETCEAYARELTGENYGRISTIGELDMAKTFAGDIRTRINVYRQTGTAAVAIRVLRNRIPTLDELHMPPSVAGLANLKSGLVLVTGETGCGKTTTLASIINLINSSRACNIITLEDPIEYVYSPDKSIIQQRQIGTDTESYANGLKATTREDPDIVLVGEMRDLDTIEAALTAAETGHLVFSTLHTLSAADTIDRVVSVFPEGQQKQIRTQLGSSLKAVVSQKLLKRASGEGRIAVCEVMIVTPAIRNLIREGKTNQIDGFIVLGSQEGSIGMDAALNRLVKEGEITRETALTYARDPDRFPKY